MATNVKCVMWYEWKYIFHISYVLHGYLCDLYLCYYFITLFWTTNICNKCVGKKPMELWRTLLGVWNKTKVNPKEGIIFLPFYFICKTNLCVLLYFLVKVNLFFWMACQMFCDVLWCHLTHVILCDMLSGMGRWLREPRSGLVGFP